MSLTRETVQLERESAQKELAAYAKAGRKPSKRSLDEEARSAWEVINGRSDEMLYAGDFDQ